MGTMAASANATALREFHDAVRAAKAVVIGAEAVELTQHARLATVAIRAFGDTPDAAFFIEMLPPVLRLPRPDLVIAHPDLGVLVIENKGIGIDDVCGVEADMIDVRRDGATQREKPFLQAEKVMYRLKDLLKKRRVYVDGVAFNCMTALPCIEEASFVRRFGRGWSFHTIFRDALDDPNDFRIYVRGFVDHEVPRLFDNVRLSPIARGELLSIFRGTAPLAPPASSNATPAPKHTAQQAEILKTDVRGAHRLYRGVAGSGKTVLLTGLVARAWRRMIPVTAAAASARPPRILVCCYNRTLVQFLRSKLELEFGRLCWSEPSWKSVEVMHVEHLLRRLQRQQPRLRTNLTFDQASQRAEQLCERFDALTPAQREPLQYDAVFVDEAQDLEPDELRLLQRLARSDPSGGQTLAIFYDNAQNIYAKRPPTWEHLGINIVGRTAYLDQCLRNTTQTLDLAMNVLIGSAAPEGVRAQTRQFADVANLRGRGLIDENGAMVRVRFAARAGAPPDVRRFDSRAEEVRFVIDRVIQLIEQDRCEPSDILILCRSTGGFVATRLLPQIAAIAGRSMRFGVRAVGRNESRAKNEALLQPDVLTVSTIHSAKGYDASHVFLLGVDELPTDSPGRALFYVGATRARERLCISGIAAPNHTLLDECLACTRELAPAPPLEPDA